MATFTYNSLVNIDLMYQMVAATNTYTSVNTTTGAYFTNTFAVNDAIIFARGSSFDDLVPTVGTALAGTGVTGKWQYMSNYDETGTYAATTLWRDFPTAVTDGTNGLTTLGQRTVAFIPPKHWGPVDGYSTNPTNFPAALNGYYAIRYVITAVTTATNGGANATNPVMCGNNLMVVTAATATTITAVDLNTAQPTIFEFLYQLSASGVSRFKYDIMHARASLQISTNVDFVDNNLFFITTRGNIMSADTGRKIEIGVYESTYDVTKSGGVLLFTYLSGTAPKMGTGTLNMYDSRLLANTQFGAGIQFPLVNWIDAAYFESNGNEPGQAYGASSINTDGSVLKRVRAGFQLGLTAAITINELRQIGITEMGGQMPNNTEVSGSNFYRFATTYFGGSGTFNFFLTDTTLGAGGITLGSTGDQIVFQRYSYNLNVVNASNVNINGATVVINDTTGANVTNTTTDASGNIALQKLNQSKKSQLASVTTTTTLTPHTLYVGGYTYNTFTAQRNMNNTLVDSAKLATDSYVSAAYATANAYTGFAINWSTMVVTISSNHTYQELYDWLKAQYIQGTNLALAQPMTTTDGVNYSLAVDIVLNAGISLTGAGKTLNLKTHKLTYSSATSSCTMTVYNGTLIYKAIGTYSESYNALTLDFQAAGSYDLRSATVVGTLTLKDTTVPGAITVNLSPGVANTNTDPTRITVVQSSAVVVNITGMSANAQVRVTRDSDSAELLNTAAVSGAASFNYTYSVDVPCHYSVRDSSQAGTRYLEATGAFTIKTTGASVSVNQVVDSNNTVAIPAPTGWTVTFSTKVISATAATVLTGAQLYAYLMDLADDSANMQYSIPATAQVAGSQYTLGTGWTFAANTEQFLKTGGWNYSDNSAIYTNVQTLGAGSRTVYISQNAALLTSWWAAGNLDVVIKVKSAGALIGSGNLHWYTRDFNYIFNDAQFSASSGGVVIQAIATGTDLSNQTAAATVSGYGVTLTWGTVSKDIGDGTGAHNYDVIVDGGGLAVSKVYEYLKYITRNGATALLPPTTGVQGQLYTSVNPATYTVTNNGPFATYAGTKIFGSQGVWIQNVAAADNLNYQVIDSAGASHLPPSFITVTGFTGGSRVYLYNTDGAASPAWVTATAKTVGQGVLRTAGIGTESGGGGLWFECTTAGTTGSTEPTWNTTVGGTTTDGTVTWTTRSVILNNTNVGGTTVTVNYIHTGTSAANRNITCKVAYVTPITATATATMGVNTATVGAGGTGYTSAPTVTLSGGGGSGATATATVTTGAVSAVTITNAGTGYTTPPTISFSGGGGTGATATCDLKVISATVGTIGTGYTTAPAVSFSGGAGTGATASATVTSGTISAITISAGGTGYTSVPTVTIAGSGATIGAKQFVSQLGIITSTGLTFTVAQVNDTVYNSNAIDGSTITEFSVTGTTVKILANATGGTDTVPKMYNWWVYTLFTATGIRDQVVTNFVATDTAHYQFFSGQKVKNVTSPSVALLMTGGVIYDSTGLVSGLPNCIDTTGYNIYLIAANVEPYSSAGVGTVSQVADAVWNAATSSYTTGGTFGKTVSFIKTLLS